MRKVICQTCGKKNKEDNMFCAGCGANLTEQILVNAEISQNTAQPKKRKMPIILGACAVVMAVVAGIAVYAGITKTSKQSTQSAKENETLFNDGLIPYKDGDYYGYLNTEGNIAINPQFDEAENFSEGIACVGIKDDNTKYGYIDTSGNYIVNPQFDFCRSFVDGMAVVVFGDYQGVIDTTGNYIINPQYEKLKYIGNYMFLVSPNNNEEYMILLDKNGTQISQTRFSMANYRFSFETTQIENSELIPLQTINDKYCYINHEGEIVINADYDKAEYFSEGLAAVKINEKWGYINETGETVITPQFDTAYSFSEGLASVGMYNSKKSDTLYGYINTEGKYVINTQYNWAGQFKDGVAIIETKEKNSDKEDETKCKLIDTNGTEISDTNISDISSNDYDHERLLFKENDKYGFMDSTGAIIINSQFPYASEMYTDGYAVVVTDNKKFTVIDKMGNKIWGDLEFEGLVDDTNDIFCKENGCTELADGEDGYCSAHYEKQNEKLEKQKAAIKSSSKSSSSSSETKICGTWSSLGGIITLDCYSDGDVNLESDGEVLYGTWSYDSDSRAGNVYDISFGRSSQYRVYVYDSYLTLYYGEGLDDNIKLFKED
ncbi:MAG: WG repeat-containing protein [Oscillospiraceae bacterium]|nr:WG repeat-containing protein [Oscillospiraceae bacterium]